MDGDAPHWPAGWQPQDWLDHLRTVAETCKEVRPDVAEDHLRAIDSLERWLVGQEEP